jgi:hypothetical protein
MSGTQYVTYDSFYPEVMLYYPGIPELVLENAIRNACIEFCERTDWLLYTPIPQQLTALENEYDLTLDLPVGAEVARVQSMWANQLPLTPKDEEDLRRIYGLDWRNQSGTPAFYTQYTTDTAILCPFPTQTVVAALGMTLVVRPRQDSTSVDPSLLNRWREVIGAGARARLAQIPGQAYESAKGADRMTMKFEAGVMEGIRMRNRGLTRSTLRVRAPRLV